MSGNELKKNLIINMLSRVIKSAPIKREVPNVCVFCGSNMGSGDLYKKEATDLAAGLVKLGYGLVYGGASVGIMGSLADSVLTAGGRVHGVIPQALVDKEVAHRGLSELRVVKTMHERKKIMFDLSDVFLTFPGGFGTLDETFEIITWKQIGLHQKPLVLLDLHGFYTPLIEFLDKAVLAGFIKEEHRKLFLTASSIAEALKFLQEYDDSRSPAAKIASAATAGK